MLKDIATLHKLYLKQINFLKDESFNEVLPLSFNYQDMIIVVTGIIDCGSYKIVYQTHDCGCGPQPTVRGTLLDGQIDWAQSRIREHLLSSGERSDYELADQQIFKTVYQIRKTLEGEDKELLLAPLQKHFGAKTKIKSF